MKVIFLDIDGVLNNTSTEETFEDYYFVEDEKAELLKQLVTRTNAKLVLSSTWREGWYARERIENPSKSFKSAIRLFEALEKKLSEYDLELLSYTEDFGTRGEEIDLWLNKWKGEAIENFIILDDMYPEDIGMHSEKLLQTSESLGLTQEDVEKAINILNAKDKNCFTTENEIKQKAITLPKYDPHKKNLPKRCDYIGAVSWLKAVQECLGESVVFALDEALMCDGSFCGRNDEYLVWVYGDDSLTRFNGVVVLDNYIDPQDIKIKNGLSFTNFNRTLYDAFVNESVLDMQGITEALSCYYYSNNESFDGITVAPKYQYRFKELAKAAIEYYDNK